MQARLMALLKFFIAFVMVGLLLSALTNPAAAGKATFGGYKSAWEWITGFGEGANVDAPNVDVNK